MRDIPPPVRSYRHKTSLETFIMTQLVPSRPQFPRSSGRTTTFLRQRKTAMMATAFGLGILSLAALDPNSTKFISQAHAEQAIATNAVSFADVVERVKPAVVSVRIKGGKPQRKRRLRNQPFDGLPEGHPFNDFFRRFGEEAPGFRGEKRQQRPHGKRHFGQGSGFIISEDGYIVTNNHVVEKAKDVEVVTNDGTAYEAKVIGTDPKTDLALLKVDTKTKLPTVKFSETLPRVGDWVVAVGNPFGLGGTVTAGIVSARGRDIGSGPYDDYLQIDAAVNRGNSGGPTFDLNGNVVGINTAIFSPSGGNVGIAFAISADVAQNVIADLKDDGKVTRGWLGVRIQKVTQEIADSLGLEKAKGALVTNTQDDSPAMKAGIQTGDTILAVNDKSVSSPKDLARQIADLDPGQSTSITVWRDGKRKDVKVQLGKLSNSSQFASAPNDGDTVKIFETLGLELATLDKDIKGAPGVVIANIDPDGAAAGRGLNNGDIIREIGGVSVKVPEDIETGVAAARKKGRKSVLMRIENRGQSRFVAIPLT